MVMNSTFAGLCLLVMVTAIATSGKKLRTVVYGVLISTLATPIYSILVVGLQLNEATATAFGSIMYILSAYTMWAHSRATWEGDA
jgi:uncharacterized membrane protein YwaF